MRDCIFKCAPAYSNHLHRAEARNVVQDIGVVHDLDGKAVVHDGLLPCLYLLLYLGRQGARQVVGRYGTANKEKFKIIFLKYIYIFKNIFIENTENTPISF